jgi:hypothetical protein
LPNGCCSYLQEMQMHDQKVVQNFSGLLIKVKFSKSFEEHWPYFG